MEELGIWLGTRLLPIARGFFNFLLMFRAHRGVLLQVCSPPFTTAAFPVCILFVVPLFDFVALAVLFLSHWRQRFA